MVAPVQAHVDAGRRRRPDAKLDSALRERNGPEGPLPDLRRHPGHGTQPRGCQPPAGAVRRLRDDPCVLHDELMRITTWGERHRRLVGRLLLVLILTLIVDAVGTVLVYSFERGVRGGDIHTFGDALFFTTVQLLTVSSQIRNPLTPAGKLVDVLLEVWAVIVVAGSAGAVAAFFQGGDS